MYNVLDVIEGLGEKYGMDAIAVFIQAESGYKNIKKGNMEGFVRDMFSCGHQAKFRHWYEGCAEAMRRFCHICNVDPGLIEAYLGIRMEEVAEHIKG